MSCFSAVAAAFAAAHFDPFSFPLYQRGWKEPRSQRELVIGLHSILSNRCEKVLHGESDLDSRTLLSIVPIDVTSGSSLFGGHQPRNALVVEHRRNEKKDNNE